MKQDTGKQYLASNELAALVAQAKAGDQNAFTELYDRTAPELYRCIRAMTRDEDLSWDIQQDSYLRAFQSLDKLENDEAFLPWLRRKKMKQYASGRAWVIIPGYGTCTLRCGKLWKTTGAMCRRPGKRLVN